ncbi:M23 family metallopeptidase [Virgibacillus sp. NKC19-3]|uniref:M23 family metallopeptidase n=1 Tax=Virgibacillus saliphilus TaxID=2831674 RepID=UPI001C9B607F|nr:M23 family metallopeptidase [Virgibacillus sp. NKC19-3]MBY7143258.1 M23 family metallopeptidase [Virgibacillus sp. NKC19-3]
MNKGVKKVRQSIEQRKKTRGLTGNESSKKQLPVPFPQEEEKHGYFPSFSDTTFESNTGHKFPYRFMLKGVLSVMLFFGVALLGQTDAAFLQKPKEWTSSALTDEFPFAKVNIWYQETFGSPLALTPQNDQVAVSSNQEGLPVSGDVTETFQVNGTGIMIAPDETADVAALRDGVVVFAGNDRETNNTVVIQHADGSSSTYGHLSAVDVHLYQFVASNQRVGQFTPTAESETVYFSIEQEDDYIDPVQVIQVDDAP